MKHLFFDLDHTLWDFNKNSEAALRILFSDLQLERIFPSFESFHHHYKAINGEMWYLYGKGKITKAELRIRRFLDTLKKFEIHDETLAESLASGYVRISPYQKNLFPGTHETLRQLKDDGHVLHIITNGFMEIQDIKLRTSEIRDYFDVVLCSEEVGVQKPHADVFQSALQRAGAKAEESVMIGDNLHTDILGAARVGIKGILFDPHGDHREGTHEWQIRALKEIPEILPWLKKP
jgi:putative hydrolase of the HAD superfamily